MVENLNTRVSAMVRTAALASAVTTASAAFAQTVTVETGDLAGSAQGDVQVFRGIPYAAPPVGPLRWKPPQPAEKWSGLRDATAFGTVCPQPHRTESWAQVGAQSEDCLFLNIWRPTNPGTYPVMVFVHGGSFNFGASSVPLYDGTSLAERGVVVVTINYRLGRLGFFAHPALTAEDPDGKLGNYGLMDAIAALDWVKRNIGQFSGDAGNVMVFGESAGAGMVQMLMGAPDAAGLFHKAASQSGSGSTVFRDIRKGEMNAELRGQEWAAGLGLQNATADQLRAVPVADVINSGVFPFIDGKVVQYSPGESFYKNKQAKVPLIIGANSNEATLGGMTEASAKAMLGDDFAAMRDGYMALSGKSADEAAVDLAEDLAFVMPSFALADQHAGTGNPAFAYYFDQVHVSGRGKLPGVGHGGELEYVFGTKPAELDWDAQDEAVSRLMGDYWARFAKTGNPNGDGAPAWPEVSSLPTDFLYVSGDTHGERLAPVREEAKAAAMKDPIRQWVGQ